MSILFALKRRRRWLHKQQLVDITTLVSLSMGEGSKTRFEAWPPKKEVLEVVAVDPPPSWVVEESQGSLDGIRLPPPAREVVEALVHHLSLMLRTHPVIIVGQKRLVVGGRDLQSVTVFALPAVYIL